MHMFGQHHPGIDMKGMAGLGGADRVAQQLDFADQQVAAAVAQVHGEEISGAGDTGAAVVGHGGSSLSIRWWNHGGQAARCPPYESPSPRRVDGHPVENREAFSAVDMRATRWSIRWWEPWWASCALSTLRKPITA